jgi:two-component system, NtrC family, response regulator HydG
MSQHLRILVVDDDPDNAASLGELFELEGHAVSVVHSGQDAIDSYLTETFDLAFMDVMMPGKNGVESFLEIRRMKPLARVVMMSGYSVEELMQQAVNGGALGILDKPLDPEEVIRMTESIGRGGMLLAATTSTDTARSIEGTLNRSGRTCDVIEQEADFGKVRDSDSVLVINAPRPLIEDVVTVRKFRARGHEGPAILIPHPPQGCSDGKPLLRDVGVTGILNKPFDPLELLMRLPELAA